MAKKILKQVLVGIFGGIAWILGMYITFGPAQKILANPAYQSEKFLTVMGYLEPLPRVAGHMEILAMGLIGLGIVYSFVFSFLLKSLGESLWKRGLKFGIIAWALSFLWFEFYLPWNAMHEPVLLVMLELACWLIVMLIVGLALSYFSRFLLKK